MRKTSLVAFLLLLSSMTYAQKESEVKFQPYGFICNYICYDSRESITSVGEMFNIMPKDILLNEDGTEDLNAVDKLTYVSIVSRFGVNVTGFNIGKARSSARLEADFCGFGTQNTVFRLRQAYVALDWDRVRLLCGQTWHPMVDQMMPAVVGVAIGSPFAPFNCSPQLKVTVDMGKQWEFLASALYQFTNLSVGPLGADVSYSRWSKIPELYASFKYAGEHFMVGAGVDILSLVPRLTTTVQQQTTLDNGTVQMNEVTHRANDRVWGFSPELFASYKKDKFNIMAKVMYAQNTAHLTMISGFGATDYNPETGDYKYAPINSSVSWVNATYGQKWKVGLMLGYIQNLGSTKNFLSLDDFWVRGAKNTDYIYRFSPSVTYTVNRFQLALEADYTVVGYGDLALNGRTKASHDVGALRACLMVKYSF